jgi:hypothetical protein
MGLSVPFGYHARGRTTVKQCGEDAWRGVGYEGNPERVIPAGVDVGIITQIGSDNFPHRDLLYSRMV